METLAEKKMNHIEQRIAALDAMNYLVRSMNDENGYFHWIMIVPEEATYEEISKIASNDWQFDHVCSLFNAIVGYCGEYGYYFGSNDNGVCKAFGYKGEE